ncbi:stage VI sporulation protein D [Alkalihalobacillus deserti]|uniref:stage VI sporulation protein D n=1 Tax=Alkalihalobacillus deserti TaxID=2879466 RepID=UPI001D155CC4|nr:stage VI sporulation protein D [Alkalihalobacillus deserti]
MTQEHPSKLSFSIEESVWLNKGQEVEEILGMSLEPEIVIEEKDHHVYIKGGLRLVGEYRSSGNDTAVDVNSGSLEELVSFRSAEDIKVSSDGTGEIKHFFPIDVTIPISRIQNLDDVYVQVESFDYDLPEKSCIQLTADISISGMTQQIDQPDKRVEKKEKVEKAEEAPNKLESVPTAFSFEARKRSEPEAPASTRLHEPTPIPFQRSKTNYQPFSRDLPPQQPPAMPVEEPKSEAVTSPSSRFTQPEQEEPTLPTNESPYDDTFEESVETEELEEIRAEAEEQEEAEEVEEVEDVEDDLEAVEDVPEEVREIPLAKQETKINIAPLKQMATPAVVKEKIDSEEADSKPLTPREENALYLTKMLSKGEERFSKWRMCIIQENESLDTIADRYKISTSQLVRMNNLQGEQVEEGQILYIPVKVES